MRIRTTIARISIALAVACAATTYSPAQTATLSASGGGFFGTVFGGAAVVLSVGDCQSTVDDGVYYGTLTVTVDNFENGVDVGWAAGEGFQASVGSNGFVPPGTYSVSGNYTGYSSTDSNGNACGVGPLTATGTAVVPQAVTLTSVTAPATSIQAGQTISLPVSITLEQFQPPPSGTATLYYGSRALASQEITAIYNSENYSYSGAATVIASTKDVPPGNYPVFVAYSGDTNYAPSSSTAFTVKIIAAQQATTTALSITPNPVLAGETAVLSATVTPTGNVTPTGKVTLLANGSSIGSLTLNPSTGAGTLSVPADIAAGTYSIQALYGGDTYNLPSTSAPVSVTVATETSTTTALTITPSTLTQGQTTQVTATVTPQIGNVAPTGSVTISANGDTLTSLPLHNGSATIQVSTASYPPGTYSVIASYLGNSTNHPSDSTAQNVTVLHATTVVVSASPNPVAQGSVTTLTATVTGANDAPVTSGTVAFGYSGNSLGSAPLNSSGVAQLPISTTGLATGSYVIQANFTGNSTNPSATGTVTLVVK